MPHKHKIGDKVKITIRQGTVVYGKIYDLLGTGERGWGNNYSVLVTGIDHPKGSDDTMIGRCIRRMEGEIELGEQNMNRKQKKMVRRGCMAAIRWYAHSSRNRWWMRYRPSHVFRRIDHYE